MKNSKQDATLTSVATVNNQKIVIINNGEKRVAIKPICQALGIDSEAQRQRILRDEILSSVAFMVKATGTDKKEYDMFSIPFKFVFGWLFSIDTSKVKPEAKEAVIKYKLQCYDALYNHFTVYAEFVEYKQDKLDEKTEILKTVKLNFSQAKNRLKETENEFDIILDMNFDSYRESKSQLALDLDTNSANS